MSTDQNNNVAELVQILERQLAETQQANKTFQTGAAVALVLMFGFMLYSGMAIRKMTEPVALAETTAGLVISSMPEVTGQLRASLVDGAPDLAGFASNAIVDLIPQYRVALERELVPVMDEVSAVLANVAVTQLVRASKDGAASDDRALQAAADEVLARLDVSLDQALDEPMEHGDTPRHMIDQALRHLQVVDVGLRRMAQGQGDPQHRELVMTWLDLIARYQQDAETARIEDYKVTGKTP